MKDKLLGFAFGVLVALYVVMFQFPELFDKPYKSREVSIGEIAAGSSAYPSNIELGFVGDANDPEFVVDMNNIKFVDDINDADWLIYIPGEIVDMSQDNDADSVLYILD